MLETTNPEGDEPSGFFVSDDSYKHLLKYIRL